MKGLMNNGMTTGEEEYYFKKGYVYGRTELDDGIDRIIQFIKDNSFEHKIEYNSFEAIGSSIIISLLEQLKI